MISQKELDDIFAKDKLNFTDIQKLDSHLCYIVSLEKEYGENIDIDVIESLEKDLENIIERLQKERKFLLKKQLKVIENE